MCKIEFKVGNAAFRNESEADEDGNSPLAPEAVADAVRDVADRIACGEMSGVIVDVNGNTVGKFSIED